jgi:hypothetical protein
MGGGPVVLPSQRAKIGSVSFGDLVGVLPQPVKANTVEKMTRSVGKIIAKKHQSH